MGIHTSSGFRAAGILKHGYDCLANKIADKNFTDRVIQMGKKTNTLASFIQGYTLTDDPAIDTDDEILNWVFVDVTDDLGASIWNLSSGFYKTAASTMRGALELGAVSLYFQRLENEEPKQGGYNAKFAAWDSGDDRTPSWGTTKPLLKRHANIAAFDKKHGKCIIDITHEHFHYLCSFTHGRAFSQEDGHGTNSMNLRNLPGEFHEDEFDRLCLIYEKTIAMVASMWVVTYPHIISVWEVPDSSLPFVRLDELFMDADSKAAFEFAKGIRP